MVETYNAKDFGGAKEEAMIRKYNLQKDDAEEYFLSCIKPRLDRSYKLYIAYNGDRAKEIKPWQANVFVPYTHAVVETLMPRILDARPDFGVQGRTEDDQMKSGKLQQLGDYNWEIARMDSTSEMVVRSSLIYGTGFLQVSWKKDKREHLFLDTKDLATKKKYKWNKRTQVFYDAPYAEWVDNYDLWYDWRNVPRESKQFWFKRKILSGAEIKRKYPMYDKKRLEVALAAQSGNLTDYAAIRNQVKYNHENINKNSDRRSAGGSGFTENLYQNTNDPDLKMHEVFEWWRPFDDAYAVMVNDVPILKGGVIPMPYDFKETVFIDFPYLKMPNEFEGMGLPLILENPQIMVNMIKNQRLDAMTLNIHKMWIVNPLANIDKTQLVTRPFGIIYSTDPNGVKEVQFSDVKASAYKEEELLKGDMRYASGVDDFSMGVGGDSSSATEVRHLRESTLERIRLFINHLGDGYATMLRYWISMWKQFYTKQMIIRIVGEDGELQYPLIEKDDLRGEFDYKATVIPSIAGKADIDKKQGMDLFQLLIQLPFVDPKKLTSKVLHNWNWSLQSIAKADETGQFLNGGNAQMGPEAGGVPPEVMAMMQGGGQTPPQGANLADMLPNMAGGGDVPPQIIKGAVGKLGGKLATGANPFSELANPINLLQAGGLPPTAAGLSKTTNPRGLNRTGKVNTNIPLANNYSDDSQLLNRAANLQK